MTNSTNAIPRVPHLVGTNKVVILEDVYGDINDETGIKKIESTDDLPADYDSYKSPVTLYASGVLRRAKVILSNKKIRVIYFVAANCPKIATIVGKEYLVDSGLTIKNAYFPLSFTYK